MFSGTSDKTVYVGVDIGWSCNPTPDSTGVSTIVGDELVDMQSLQTDGEIAEYVDSRDADYVGIDAPLVVRNVTGRRGVEDTLDENGINALPANRTWFNEAFGGVRGESIVDELGDVGYELDTRRTWNGLLSRSTHDRQSRRSSVAYHPTRTTRSTPSMRAFTRYGRRRLKQWTYASMSTSTSYLWILTRYASRI